MLLALGLALLVLGRGLALGWQLLAPLPGVGEHLLVQGCVGSIPMAVDTGWQFDARVHFPRHADWSARNLRMQLPAALPAPAVGECWQYAARLSQPRSVAGRRTLLRNRLSGYARVDAGPLNRRLSPGQPGLATLRARLAQRIADQVADPSAAALLAALAVGVTGDVSPRQWQVFNATGITHLVAISGMHVTFFALLAMAAARQLWKRIAPRAWLPRRTVFALAVGCALALLYALLSGFSVPAQRTVVMLAAFLGMRECARCTPPVWSVGVALCAVLLYDPMALLGAGFWLSFAAVVAIVVLAGGRLQLGARMASAVRLQWVVSIALLPITIAIFGSFSAIGILVNLVAIPVFSVLLVPPVLVATACFLLPGMLADWCGGALLQLAGWVAGWLWPGLVWCADLPDVLWHAAPPVGWYLLVLPMVLMALLPVAGRMRIAALGLLGSVFLLRAPRPAHGELWIDAQGQGGAATVLLRTHAHLLLLGTGETYGSAGRRFARQVLPLLRASGYPRLDLWLPGTLTREVQSALRLAAAEIPVTEALLPPAHAPPPELGSCVPAYWQWDGVEFQLRSTGNGRACLLTASCAGHSIELGEADVSEIAESAADGAHLVLDDAGLTMRSALIRL